MRNNALREPLPIADCGLRIERNPAIPNSQSEIRNPQWVARLKPPAERLLS
jgi:hypothetical protein